MEKKKQQQECHVAQDVYQKEPRPPRSGAAVRTGLPSDRSVSCGVVARDTEKPPLSRMDASSSDSSESVMAMARAVVFTSTWGAEGTNQRILSLAWVTLIRSGPARVAFQTRRPKVTECDVALECGGTRHSASHR